MIKRKKSIGRYQYAEWLCAMLVIFMNMIQEDQSCLSKAPLHIKQDTLHQYTSIEVSKVKLPLRLGLRLTCKGTASVS